MKLRALCVFILCLFSFNAYSQDIWEDVDCSDLKWGSHSKLNILSDELTYLEFWNSNALTEDNIKNNRYTYHSVDLPISKNLTGSWRITFSISNLHNNPAQGYSVFNENQKMVVHKENVYWGFGVNVKDTDANSNNWIQYYSNNSYGDSMSEKESQEMRWVNLGTNTLDSERKILIEYDGYWTISVYDVSYAKRRLLHTFYNAVEIQSISPHAGPAGNVVVKDFKVQRLISWDEIDSLVNSGDKKLASSDYQGAIDEYTKAINYGRKDYYVYFQRARAYLARGDYYGRNYAIIDLIEALSYEETEEAYYELGLTKLGLGIMSGVNDLKKCGPRGYIVLSKMNL